MFGLFKKNAKPMVMPRAGQACVRKVRSLTSDPYLYVPESMEIISVFDDTQYDRSDFDNLSPAMRHYVKKKLLSLGFTQISGRVFENNIEHMQCEIPKSSVQGASPFHATHYSDKREGDFFILTPTQTACFVVDHFPLDQAVEKIVQLVARQPINIFKLKDYLEGSQAHKAFAEALPFINYKQRLAVESAPLNTMRSIKL